ncbi:MAG: EAL domain-containing protein [Woeseiaceae bacterium]|nr:EAL domain-containing protein [Woeseiaceae bacterium]
MARELSLSPVRYRDALALDRHMEASARRIVLVTRKDLTPASVAVLGRAGRTPFGLIVAADREALRLRGQEHLLDDLAGIDILERIPGRFDTADLARAARACHRRLLRISEADLRQAIAGRELHLKYQPKVGRSDGHEWHTSEAEALLRWQHPELGWLGPLEFLPELEAFGLMGEVSDFVLAETAAQLVRWRRQGLELDGCINLASSQLHDPQLAARYADIVGQHGLQCANFTFEVIEQDIADSAAPHLRILNDLREHGFRISLDDFGIAAASLGTLEAIPVDEIKIHAAALERARQNDIAQKVLAAVTGLAHNLGISVCAEGVEDTATCEFLDTIGCDKLQGHLISEAVMPELIQAGYRTKAHAVA